MNWQELSLTELDDTCSRGPVVAILPLGAIEAHGPHLPVGTDVWIAEAMARDGAERLGAEGIAVLILPPLAYAPAPFANAHAAPAEEIRAAAEKLRAQLVEDGWGEFVPPLDSGAAV